MEHHSRNVTEAHNVRLGLQRRHDRAPGRLAVRHKMNYACAVLLRANHEPERTAAVTMMP
jgi:hypothetical protein